MGNVKSKRTLDISSTPKKEAVVVKVGRLSDHHYQTNSVHILLVSNQTYKVDLSQFHKMYKLQHP